MNKIKKQTILYLLLCICLCSCEREALQEGVKQSYIQLSMPGAIHVDTKAGSLDGITISNVWIVQFNEETSACLKALYVPGSAITSSNASGEDQVVVNLETGKDDNTKFSDIESRFYVIANGGISLLTTKTSDISSVYVLTSEELDSLTEKGLKELTQQIGTSNNPLVTDSPVLLTSAPTTYKPGTDGVIKIRTQMFRAFAKIMLKITYAGPAGGGFSLTGSNIYNLPKKMAMYRAGGSSATTYPAIGDISTGAFALNISDFSTGSSTTTKTFYMAENLRGVGKSTTQQGKNQAANGPEGSLSGCTYIEIEGTYKYNTSHANGVKVKYTFYLGGNFTNDYNIARDYSYELTFNIAGPNSADVRVQITDGNVAVFDEVDVVDNIIVDF